MDDLKVFFEEAVKLLEDINSKINSVMWGFPMIALIVGVGLYFTVRTKFFQFTHFKYILDNTLFSLFRNKKTRSSSDSGALSQFQTISTALAGAIGTGNIVGVATAITLGGPGAIFWMWISALIGMITIYAENVLGIMYRKRNEKGQWVGGAMYYLENAFKGKRTKKLSKAMARFFSFACIGAAFGIGNMVQVNSISAAMKSEAGVPTIVTGIILCIICGLILSGGFKRIGAVSEKIVPVTSVLYILGSLIVLAVNIKNLPAVFLSIFRGAFGLQAAGGGVSGAVVWLAVSYGFKRGVFSNEAGLGTSVMIGTASDADRPQTQGMWGIFQVFFDTIVICTLTALVILSSGMVNLENGVSIYGFEGVSLVSEAFSTALGNFSGCFVSVSMILFAFATVIGWSYYGEKSWEYVFGRKNLWLYRYLFIFFIMLGAVLSLNLVWEISDTINAFMALPNLIGLIALSSKAIRSVDDLSLKKH